MSFVNQNYTKKLDNIFYKVSQKVETFKRNNPYKQVISLGIGDVTRPFSQELTNVMLDALSKQQFVSTFKGYPPEQGYLFLREKIKQRYSCFGANIKTDEIFIGNGIGCDIANILDIFQDYTPLIIEPTYPEYFVSNILNGKNPLVLNATKQNNFCVLPKNVKVGQYLIYLCSPNNPTGYTYTKQQLREWIDFANKTNSIILIDLAYESFIQDNLPHTTYSIPGAKKCVIEFCSFSKMAGFTNLRCSYTIIPKTIQRENVNLNKSYQKRQLIKFNGVPYFVQVGAEYDLSPQGQIEQQKNIEYYKNNVKIICYYLEKQKCEYVSSNSTPYVWLKCPKGKSSWQFFNELLKNYAVVVTPGCGFGKCGEGYVRLSGFNSMENTVKACEKICEYLKKEKCTT